MAETKEAYLDQSYYGPTIPPTETNHRTIRPKPPNCSPYSLLCIIFKIFTIIIIAIGVVVLILWLIFQPHDLKVYVEDATLSRFDLAPNNDTLYYNLTLSVSFRNPNEKVGIHYERLEARAFYDDSRFAYLDFPRFHQPRKNTTIIKPRFIGQSLLAGSSPPVTYRREKGEGWIYVSVKMYTRVRLKMIVVNSVEYRPEVDCFLRLPVPTNATSLAEGFTRTKCDADSFS